MKIIEIISENAVKDLEKDLKHPYSYNAIDHMMTTIAKRNNITPKKLHDLFVEKHGVIPDDWIKKQKKLDEGSNKKKKKAALYGPGPFGLYGTDTSYSGGEVGDAGVGENFSKGNLKEFATNPRDDDEGDDRQGEDGFDLPVKFVGDGRAIFLSNKRKYVSPFPRGEVFTGKAYIMWNGPQIEVIWHLDKKNPKERKAIYRKNYKERYANPLSLWYDTTNQRIQYRFITKWKLVPNLKEPGGFPGIIDAIGQDQKKQVMDDAMGFIAEIIQKDGDGRFFVEPREGLTENFADGRNPQDKGDSKRHGVPTKASVSTLRQVAKQGGRKGQLAHWMANMKAGRAKAKKNENQ